MSELKSPAKSKLHPESLLHIPLVAQMLSDPASRLSSRAIDDAWFIEKTLPINSSGFNPWSNEIFYSGESALASWLKSPTSSARRWNSEDHLLQQVLMAVHDYLHQWAYRAIHSLYPKIGFATQSILKDNFEDFVFCHLLTETVATVGLDYWYLSTIHLNDIVQIGTAIRNLTVAYHQDNLSEFRRNYPELEVQRPDFFSKTARFYMDGVFTGFNLSDLRHSPLTMKWIAHETLYGERQRRYTRQWFAHLGQFKINEKTSARKVSYEKPWQKRLINALSEILWDKVKSDDTQFFPAVPLLEKTWVTPKSSKRIDFRFFNLNSLGDDFWKKLGKIEIIENSDDYLIAQIILKYRFADFKPEKLQTLEALRQQGDLAGIRKLLSKQTPITTKPETADLFLMG